MRAIIVEDEEEGMENLVLKLQKHCPNVEIIDKCETGEGAIRAIRNKTPQIVFLDIQLGTMTGFDVLSKVPQIPFEIIFITAHEDYAIEAIRASAIDYLLKPVRPRELKKAVEAAAERIQNSKDITRILVPDGSSQVVLHTKEIMYCLADNVNTIIHRDGKKPYLTVKILKSIEGMLPKDSFHRISRSAVVNLDYVLAFHKSEGGYLEMKDGKKLSVSKPKLDDFLRKLGSSF